MSLVAVVDSFTTAYGHGPAGVWSAPGRVNLIGEHTDYNDGFVLPFALAQRVLGAASPRSDGRVRVRSNQVPDDQVTVDLPDLRPGAVDGWAAYPLGVVWALQSTGNRIDGLDLLLDGDVPRGAGLASSAALGCAVALAVDGLHHLGFDRTTLAAVVRHAENDFVGAPTGGMDQMVSMHGRSGHLMLLDTRSGQVEHIRLELDRHGLALLVIDTRAVHHLVDGEYARRRHACEQAADGLGVAALRDVSVDALAGRAFRELPGELRRRARHVVTENDRVLTVAEELRTGNNPRAVGPLLTASHQSLRDDFEVSVPELDVAVDAALAAGAYGARMTGGGFGGCVLALVDAERVPDVARAVETGFAKRGFAPPTSFRAQPAAGAQRLR